MVDAEQRKRLGDFVRAHRERLSPAAPAGRRRTPGLRREELAALAGISSVWCAWIEQGREVQASPRALARLANALGLSADERAEMFALAGRPDPDGAVAQAPAVPSAPASLVAVVEGMEHPTYALDRAWNPACWNAAAGQLLWLGDGRERNLLRYIFLDHSIRPVVPHWQDWARRLLEQFRAETRHRLDDPAIRSLIEALRCESALFAKLWDAPPASEPDNGIWTFIHPDGGQRSYLRNSFSPADRSDYTLVVLTPVLLA